MQRLVSMPKPAGLIDRTQTGPLQLAIDEAMLLLADEGRFPQESEFIRLWEFQQPTVVLGRSSRVDLETDRKQCEQRSIPIYRRASGGATVMGGPGCLMYSVILNTEHHPARKRIDVAHQFVMDRVLRAVRRQVAQAQHQGICDLTVNDHKFSGNSLRIGRSHLLYHGTFLYDFKLDLAHRCLRFAPRQPEYRKQRQHRDFMTNLPLVPEQLAEDLHDVFEVESTGTVEPFLVRAEKLVVERYACDVWRDRH